MPMDDFEKRQLEVAKNLREVAYERALEAKSVYLDELRIMSTRDFGRSLDASAPIFKIMSELDQAERASDRANKLVEELERRRDYLK